MRVAKMGILILFICVVYKVYTASAARHALGGQAERVALKALDVATEIAERSRDPFQMPPPANRFTPARRQLGASGSQQRMGGIFADVYARTAAQTEARILNRQRLIEAEMNVDALPTQEARDAARRQAREDAEKYVLLQQVIKERKLRTSFLESRHRARELENLKTSRNL
jgi:hypothetical protein